MMVLNQTISENCIFNYDIQFSNNLFRIVPYLYNEEQNERYEYTQDNYLIFRRFVREYSLYILVRIEDKKYFINPGLLIYNHALYRDNNIYFDNYKVDSYPGSKLFKICKWSIEHNQPSRVRINNYILLN
jgi:hypothetical protein